MTVGLGTASALQPPPEFIDRHPAHEFSPYCEGFDAAIKAQPVRWAKLPVEEVRFSTKHLGFGGCADVYAAYHKNGRLALKLFRHGEMLTQDQAANGFAEDVQTILVNVVQNATVLRSPLFAEPKAVGEHWYLMEYVSGETVDSLFLKGPLALPAQARILHTYASMLQYLHHRGYCFVDNNWGAVIASPASAVVCDYDCVAKERVLARQHSPQFYVDWYEPQESFLYAPHSYISDLESFALMIDHLVICEPFLGGGGSREQAALASAQEYPVARCYKLPKNLRNVVAPLIRYPRDESITIDDFVDAIERDYWG